MKKQYTERELDRIKAFAYFQWDSGEEFVHVNHEPSGCSITNPWVDWESGWREEFDTVEEVIKCYGEDLFYEFCGRVLAFLNRMHGDTPRMRFGDVPFVGDAIATYDGKVIWTNHESGDCPPDLCVMFYVKSMYIVDNQFVFELTKEGE